MPLIYISLGLLCGIAVRHITEHQSQPPETTDWNGFDPRIEALFHGEGISRG